MRILHPLEKNGRVIVVACVRCSFKLGAGVNYTPGSSPGSASPAVPGQNGHMALSQQPTPYNNQQLSPGRGRVTDGEGPRSRKGSGRLFADPASSIR